MTLECELNVLTVLLGPLTWTHDGQVINTLS